MSEQIEKDEPIDGLLSVNGLAKALRVPVSWVYSRTRLKGAGTIPRLYCGKYMRFFLPDVMAWLKDQNQGDCSYGR